MEYKRKYQSRTELSASYEAWFNWPFEYFCLYRLDYLSIDPSTDPLKWLNLCFGWQAKDASFKLISD